MAPPAKSRTSDEPPVGLREKHKTRTRTAVRQAAMELFAEQGYTGTTVDQIARRADVSHTTLFRYFATKEQVVVGDDLADQTTAAMDAIPRGLAPLEALRRIVRVQYEINTADEWASNTVRLTLINSEPALRAAFQAKFDQSLDDLTAYFSAYTGRETYDLAIRVFVGAAGGALFRIANDAANPGERNTLDDLMVAIDLLEQGLPL